MGYRSNPIPRWEAGRRFPTAIEAMRACEVVGIDVEGAVARFHPAAAQAWQSGLSSWLVALAGSTSHAQLAKRSGLSWQQVGRILRGDSRPRLPAFLAVLEAATGRSAQFIAQLVDVAEIPALAARLNRVHSIRRLAFDHPWSAGALAILETLPPRTPRDLQVQALSSCLRLPREQAAELLESIRDSGALDPASVDASLTVDVAPTHDEQLSLRAHWAQVSAQRMAHVRDSGHTEHDLFSFNLLSISREDLERIRELQRAHYRQVRGIVSKSEPELAVLWVMHTAVLAG